MRRSTSGTVPLVENDPAVTPRGPRRQVFLKIPFPKKKHFFHPHLIVFVES